MSASECPKTGSDTSYVPRKSRRHPTCPKEHFLRGTTDTMSSDGQDKPFSPATSSASTLGSPDVLALLQMLTAQNLRADELRAEPAAQAAERAARAEELRAEQAAKAEERQRIHERAMAELQAELLSAQVSSAKNLAEATLSARQIEAQEAEVARRRDAEGAALLLERQADMRREKERADQQAKLEAAIRHIKRDSPKMQSQDFPPTFMTTFERNFNEQAIPLKDWASCFLHCLGGSDANIYSTLIDSSQIQIIGL